MATPPTQRRGYNYVARLRFLSRLYSLRLLKQERGNQLVELDDVNIRVVPAKAVTFVLAACFARLMDRCKIGTSEPLAARLEVAVPESRIDGQVVTAAKPLFHGIGRPGCSQGDAIPVPCENIDHFRDLELFLQRHVQV